MNRLEKVIHDWLVLQGGEWRTESQIAHAVGVNEQQVFGPLLFLTNSGWVEHAKEGGVLDIYRASRP